MLSQKILVGRFIFVGLLGSGIAGLSPSVAEAQVVSKECSNCGASVSMSSRVGEYCPHCRAYWGSESYKYSSSGSSSYGGQPRLSPWQRAAMQKAYERHRRRSIRLERARRLRAAKLATRQRVREYLRKKTEEFRLNDDPARRAKRYSGSGVRAEEEGNFTSAIAYYRLAVRSVPYSEAASQAELALTRLEASKPAPRESRVADSVAAFRITR